MTRDETRNMLEVLVAAFPDRANQFSDPEASVTAYHMALDDVPMELAQLAVRDVIRNSKFFPRPAEVRASALKLARPIPTAQEAWGIVMLEMRRVSVYSPPEFAMPEIAQAVRSIGWRNICMSEDVERTSKRFADAYDALIRRSAETSNMLELWNARPALMEVS